MSEAEHDPPIRNQLLEEAAAWFARMRGPDAEASRPEFEAWLASGAVHRGAYNRAAEIFAMGKLIGEHDAPQPAASPAVRRSHRALILGVPALALAAGAVWLSLDHSIAPSPAEPQIAPQYGQGAIGSAVFATTNGARSVRLADGSLLRLAAASRLEVRFDQRLRRLTLAHGMARFEVAHELRPFVVRAGGGSVTARGTIFDVGYTKDRRVSVRLVEGMVDVAYPRPAGSASNPQRRRLVAGEVTSFAAEPARDIGKVEPLPAAHAKQDDARRPRAAIDYDQVPVATLIGAANRAAAPPIRLFDQRTAAKRVSGHFRIDDTVLLAERLAALFDLALERTDNAIVLKPKQEF